MTIKKLVFLLALSLFISFSSSDFNILQLLNKHTGIVPNYTNDVLIQDEIVSPFEIKDLTSLRDGCENYTPKDSIKEGSSSDTLLDYNKRVGRFIDLSSEALIHSSSPKK